MTKTFAGPSPKDGGYQQLLFGALTRRMLRAQGAHALNKEERKEAKKKREAEKVNCGCYLITHERVPHPRYGDRVAHFEDRHVIDTNCEHRRAEANRFLAQPLAEPPAAPVPFEMEPEDQEAPLQAPSGDGETTEASEGTPDTDAYRCTATTKSGARCKNTAKEGTRCGVHPE